MTGNFKRLRPYDEPPKSRAPWLHAGSDAPAKGFFGFAAFWLLTATGLATIFTLQLVMASFTMVLALPFGIQIEVTPDTVSAGFRHAFVWGWLTNAALGAIFFISHRLTGRPLARPRTAVLGMAIWNVGFAAGLTLLYIPALSDPGALTAFPLPVNLVLLIGLFLINVSFWSGLRGADRPFVSLAWFAIAMLTLLTMVAVATVFGVAPLDSAAEGVVEAIWDRSLALLWLLAVPIGALHYLVPRLTGQPLASGQLASLGLATWVGFSLVAPFGAAVHPSVPYALVSAGNAATILLLVPVAAIVTNLTMSLRSRWQLVLSPGPAALAIAALVFLGGSVVLSAIGSLREVQLAVARTEWPFGVAAFALGGASTLGLLAIAEHAWPRMLHRSYAGGLLAYVVTWAALVGALLAGAALIVAGIFHVGLVADGALPDEITSTLLPVHLVVFGGMALLGLAALAHALNMYLLAAHGRPVLATLPGATPAAASAGH